MNLLTKGLCTMSNHPLRKVSAGVLQCPCGHDLYGCASFSLLDLQRLLEDILRQGK